MPVKLTHLRLVNWRNFKNVSLKLQDRMFIVGPNAAGNTNLLDAFRFLHDIACPGGSLVGAVEKRRGVEHMRSLYARAQNTVSVEVSLLIADDPTPWTYALELVAGDKKRAPVRVASEKVRYGDEAVLTRPDADDKKDGQRLTETHLEQTSQNARFRGIAEALASVMHIHVVPQVAKGGSGTEGLAARDAAGSDFIEQLALLSPKQQASRLKRIQALLKIAVPLFSELKVTRDTRGRPHLEAKYTHWRPRGGWQNEQEFSDGTLRLIGLFWAIENGTAPLILEEPELSLHADVVRQIPRLLSKAAAENGRQFFVSTHSEEMLHDLGVEPDEVVLLRPTAEETKAVLGSEVREVRAATKAGVGLARAVRALTRPKGIEQMGLPGVA